jgi:hypothetical protein
VNRIWGQRQVNVVCIAFFVGHAHIYIFGRIATSDVVK